MPVDPELQAHLDGEAASGLPPRAARSVALTRELYLRGSLALARPVPLPRVEDLRAGEVPLRLYAAGLHPLLPALLYAHGGRFFSGDLQTHDTLCREIARESGCAVVAIDYRLAPEHRFPAAADDCEAAARWVALHAGELGLDAGRLAIGGDSAGACLAAVTVLRVPGLRAQWLIYPMLDPACALPSHREFGAGYGPGSADMRRGWVEYLPPGAGPDPRITPLHAASLSGAPPAYILTAECDTLRDEAELYARRLRGDGTPVTLVRVSGAIHGFFQYTKFSALARTALQDACGSLRVLLQA